MKLLATLSSVRKSEWMNVQNFYKSKLKCLALWILNYLPLESYSLHLKLYCLNLCVVTIFSASFCSFLQQFSVYFFIYPIILFFRVSRISSLSLHSVEIFQKIMVHLFRFFLKSSIKRYVAYCYCCCFLVETKIQHTTLCE